MLQQVKKLVPPLLVLQREDGTLVSPGGPGAGEGAPGSVGYVVAGIAHKKILFKDRPKLGLKPAA